MSVSKATPLRKPTCLPSVGALAFTSLLICTSCQPMSGGSGFAGNSARATDDALLLRQLPETLRSADRLESGLKKEYDALASRRATSPDLETLPVRAEASRNLSEINGMINALNAGNGALSRAISSATAYPNDNLGTWLNQRNQVNSRLASLRMYRSWFKTLSS